MKERTARVEREGLTYDDVLLVPSYSEVMPREVDISSYFSRNIAVKIPIVTAAMDTVTESTMAIAIAREGGLGVIHKNMSIEQQAMEVRKVKRAEAGMILQPITVNVSARVADAINIMREHKIGGIPVVNDDLVLVGIITNRD
ncbi:MAG TPA: IMP dehydrogenase, partial [Bacteroidales bacterium]|nr:IMP dehydrogenase [Bacteroidales bacterium]